MARILGRRINGLFSLPASLMVALTLPAATPAQAQPAAVHGGIGGRYFEYGCGPGQVLVGLRGSAGVLVDNIQAICARVTPNGGFSGASVQGPVFGNNRPQDQHVECPAGYAASQAAITNSDDYPHVGQIALRCTELNNRLNGGSVVVEVSGSGELGRYGFERGESNCPNNYATGIHGRAGEYLSAFGLICGQAVALAEPRAPVILNKRKKSSIVGKYPNASATTSSIPQAQKTLNKRKRPGTWGTPAPEQAGNVGASLNSDGGVGASLNSDGGVGALALEPASAPQAPTASALIGGMYATTVAITDSRCLIQGDMRGSWEGQVDVSPQPGVVIPLEQYSGFFGGPVTLNVDGLRLSQSTRIPMKFGPLTSPAPARFDGAFTEDGSRFDVQFQAGTDFCRVSGTIIGSRN